MKLLKDGQNEVKWRKLGKKKGNNEVIECVFLDNSYNSAKKTILKTQLNHLNKSCLVIFKGKSI